MCHDERGWRDSDGEVVDDAEGEGRRGERRGLGRAEGGLMWV